MAVESRDSLAWEVSNVELVANTFLPKRHILWSHGMNDRRTAGRLHKFRPHFSCVRKRIYRLARLKFGELLSLKVYGTRNWNIRS